MNVLPGEGWTGSAYSFITVEGEGFSFSAKVVNVHWSSMTPRARQAGVSRTTPSSSWTTHPHRGNSSSSHTGNSRKLRLIALIDTVWLI